MTLAAAINQLHDRCAIYTSTQTAERLLDMIGWTCDADLSKSVLLEPCVGEGAILLEAVRRLVASVRRHGRGAGKAVLLPRIKGFEFHGKAARTAKISLRHLLLEEGISWTTATELAEGWIRERDFLLERPTHVTHVAANPPYIRWGKIPPTLATMYRDLLPSAATRGDLSVAFLHRMQEWADDRGVIAALVSDRWMYAQYGDEFVRETNARGWSIDVADERPLDPFVRNVGAYSAIVFLSKKCATGSIVPRSSRATARTLHGNLVAKHGTIGDAGCRVRVGPALGAGKTFIVDPGEMADVESELVRSFVSKADLSTGEVTAPESKVIIPYDREGRLINPAHWPKFARWAAARRQVLKARSQFVNSQQYWRTIDAIPAQWSVTPKLLLPELCNKPVAAIDRTGSIPAHSLYAIWSTEWPIEVLRAVLNAGLLELTAHAEAPRLKSGWLRFYKRFLLRTPLPQWSRLSMEEKSGLSASGEKFDEIFDRLFGFPPGALTLV